MNTLDDPQDIDRAAILARRQRFVLIALGGLSEIGCERVSKCDTPTHPPSFETIPHALVTRASEPALRCDDPLLAELEAGRSMHDEDERRVALVRAGMERAEQARRAGDYACAIAVSKQTYWLLPGKHRFAFWVGEIASEAPFEPGACAVAREYLEHFVRYADPHRNAADLERARAILIELEDIENECFHPTGFPVQYAEPMPCLSMPADPEPFAGSGNCSRPQRKR